MNGLRLFFSKLIRLVKGTTNSVFGINGNGNFVVQTTGKAPINLTYNGQVSCIQLMGKFLSSWKDKNEYIAFPNFENLKKQILVEEKSVIRFLGLSGLGKSRLIYETFSGVTNDHNYYCSNASDSRVVNDLSFLLTNEQCEKGYIVLDNCDTQSFQSLLNIVQSTTSNFKIITIYNDPNESATSYGVNVLRLRRSDLKQSVDDYVNRSLNSIGCDNSGIFEQIKNMADGFPQIAIRAIEEYRKQRSTAIIRDDVLWQRMCGDTINDENKKKALRSLALFNPLGYLDEVKGDYTFICHDKDITPIYDISDEHKDDIFSSVVKSMFERELIEHTSSWILVRPLPLAVWLVGQWFANCKDERFENVVRKLDGMEDHYQSERMKRAFCKRLEYMQDNESAIQMYNRLMGENGPFRNEKVVCSDFGSRLFLAISTVNTVAVTSCLYSIISNKTTEWIKTNVVKDSRRNIVWCLEHLCFPKESFNQAGWILAKLALAENEDWGNNATGNFLQLFHVMLPGTCADLNQRLSLINRLYEEGDEAIPLLIKALERAYDYGSFTRSGGGEKFGFKRLKDFIPNGLEIINYWNGCRKVVKSLLREYPIYIKDIKELILHHTFSLGPSSGCWDILFDLLSDVYDTDPSSWPEMSKDLYTIKVRGYKLSDNDCKELDGWMERFSEHSFVEVLSKAKYKFYNDDKYKDFDERMNKVESFWKPYVNLFITRRIYDDTDAIRKLLDFQEVDYTFCKLLSTSLDEKQATSIVNSMENVIAKKDNEYASVFVNIFMGGIQYSGIFNSFCEFLLKNGKFTIYFNIVSPRETKDLSLIKDVLNVIKQYKLPEEKYLPIYLSRAPLYDSEQMYDTCQVIKETFSIANDVLLQYIFGRQYSEVILKEPMFGVTKQLVLDYIPHDSKLISTRQMNSLVDDILKKTNCPDFAKEYNLKIIRSTKDLSTFKRHENLYDNTYLDLLPKYQDVVLDDILNALSEESPLFWLDFYYELGSGTGMGSGPLFQCDLSKIKDKCIKEYKGELPPRLAQMCPVFECSKEKKGYEDRFSDFFYWMIDNFDSFIKQREILDSFHANMGTFSWTGSVLPLLNRKKKSFIALEEITKNPIVLKWIDDSLLGLNQEINREEKNDAYEELMYS